MPFVSDGIDWGINIPNRWEQVRAGSLFKPVGNYAQLPAGFVTVGPFSATAQTYTNVQTILWDSGLFNTQGQRLQTVSGTSSDGCKNVATPRTSGGVALNHKTSFEFHHAGGNLDIVFIGSSYYDCQVYIDYYGKMYKATATPVFGSTTGLMHLPITLAASFSGKIRVHLGGGLLVGIKCEQSAIVKPSPDRIFGILDGGKWADGLGIKQASGTSFLTAGISDNLFERSGIVFAERAQDSGFFYNGSATVTTDTAASDGTTRLFSAGRQAILQDDFLGKPLFFIIVDSVADSGRSGATGSTSGPMALRAKACYDWIRSKDDKCTIIHVSPPPMGTPTADSSTDFNRREQTSALAGIGKSAYINLYGPTAPAWNAAQQVPLIGVDGINPSAVGMATMAGKILNPASSLLVDTLRSRRQA